LSQTEMRPHGTRFILDFWGKAAGSAHAGGRSHSVAYHSLDVAAVCTELIARHKDRLERIATAVGIDVCSLRDVLPFLVALHDIGKYARVFQAKSPDHWPVNSLGPYREIAPGNSHVVTGFQMLVHF
jgi:CRISPR-associated endonuclease/helicase Cas3